MYIYMYECFYVKCEDGVMCYNTSSTESVESERLSSIVPYSDNDQSKQGRDG